MDLAGSAALVTGGGSGLGAATSALLARRGMRVTVLDVDADNGRRVAESIDGTFVAADVTDEDQVIAAVEVARSLAPLRAVVNCAGVPSRTRTLGKDGGYAAAHDLAAFRRVIDVNLVGTFNVVRIAAVGMSANDPDADGARGAIVNTASVAAFDGQVGQVAYSAAKAGIVGATLPLARDLAVIGVRVNTIAPGMIDTPIFDEYPDPAAFKTALARDIPFPRRLGHPDEFADLAWELLRNGYMNGEVVRIDGGIRLRPK